MAPGYRNQNRRQNRSGHVDHDVFEGLPVRHWRRDYVTVAPPPSQDTSTSLNDIWGIELPHGMPKDYHLLPQHSQDLLRGARSGRIYKRPAPAEEDEIDIEGAVPEKVDKKEDEAKDRGFAAKAWKQIPRHLEGPDVEYLAKRKRNVITIGSKAPKVVPTVTKATMKRVDAAGNEYTQDVIVPLGQHIEGEIISQTEIPDPSIVAPDGFAIQQSPIKRKPQIKKKHKPGPGRGRKKKLLPPTSVPIDVDGSAKAVPATESQSQEIKKEEDGSVPPVQSEDTEMRDGSAAGSDNDDSDGGDEDDDDESVGSGSPSKRTKLDNDVPPVPDILSIPSIPPPTTNVIPEPLVRPLLQLDERTKSGSPLKIVALASPTGTSPVKEVIEEKELPAEVEPASATPLDVALQAVDTEMQEETKELAPEIIPPAPPAPAEETVQSVVELRQEEEEEEEMLLDIQEEAEQLSAAIVEPTTISNPSPDVKSAPILDAVPSSEPAPVVEPAPIDESTSVAGAPAVIEPTPVKESERVEEPEPASVPSASVQESEPEPRISEPTVVTQQEEGGDSETDLLGDLEKSLGN